MCLQALGRFSEAAEALSVHIRDAAERADWLYAARATKLATEVHLALEMFRKQ